MMHPPSEHQHHSNNSSFVIHPHDALAATYTGPLSGTAASPGQRANGHHQRSASNSSHNAGVIAAPSSGSAGSAGAVDEMHRTFPHVPASERAIREFQCSMVKKKFMWVGRVYLTPKRLCFIGLISNNVTLEWSQIAKIERKTTVMFDQVVLTPSPDVSGGDVTFGGFTHGIDEPYQMMQTLWGVATRYGGGSSSSSSAKPAPPPPPVAAAPLETSTMSTSLIQPAASAASPTNASPRSAVIPGTKSLAEVAATGSSSADLYGANTDTTAGAARAPPPAADQRSKTAGSSSSGVIESPSSSIAPPVVSVSAEGDLSRATGAATASRRGQAASVASEEVRSPVTPRDTKDEAARADAARRQHVRGRSDSSWSAIPNFFAGLAGNKESGLSTPRQSSTAKGAEARPATTSPVAAPAATVTAAPSPTIAPAPAPEAAVRTLTPETQQQAQSPPPKVPPILRKPSSMQRQPASFASAPDSNSSGGPLASTQSFGEPSASGGPPPDPEALAAARAANGAVSPRVSNASLAHNETVLDSFQCSYVLGVHRLGRMTLTQMNVRFSSVMCNPVCVPYTEIDRVEKSTSLMILESLLLVLRDGTRHEFTSFTGSRDRVYGMVCDLVRSHAQVNAALGIGPTPTQSALAAGKEDTPPLTAAGAPAVTPRALDPPTLAAAAATAAAASPAASTPADAGAAAAAAANLPRDQRPENLPASLAKMRAARFVTSLIAPPESAWPVLPSLDEYDTLMGTDVPAGGFNSWEKLKKETIIDKMPLPPGYTLTDVFRFVLDDDARFALDYRVSRQDTDSTFEPWRPCKKPDGSVMPSSGQRITRCKTIIRALTATVCPYTEFNRVLACQLDGQPYIITHYSGQAVGVMFSDTFRVETMILYRYQTPPGAPDGAPPQVIATVQFYINFIKSTIVKGRIRANATPETTEGYKSYLELAGKTLKALCPLDGPPVIGPQGEIIPRARFAVGTVAENPMVSYSASAAAPADAGTAGQGSSAQSGDTASATAAARTAGAPSPIAASLGGPAVGPAGATAQPATSGGDSMVTTVVSTLLDLPPGPTIRRVALGLCAYYCLRAFCTLLFSPHFEAIDVADAALRPALNLMSTSPAFVGLATGVRHLVTALVFFLAAKCAAMW